MAENNNSLSTSVTISLVDNVSGSLVHVGKVCRESCEASRASFYSLGVASAGFTVQTTQMIRNLRSLAVAFRTAEVSAGSFRRALILNNTGVAKLNDSCNSLAAAQNKHKDIKFSVSDEAVRRLELIGQKLQAVHQNAASCIEIFNNLSSAIASVGAQIGVIKTDISSTGSKIKSSMDQAASGSDKLKTSLSGVQDRLKNVSAIVKKVGGEMQRVGGSLKSIGINMLGAAGAVTGGAVKIVKDYADVQYSESELKNMLTGKTESDKASQAAQFNQLAMTLATTLPGSVKDMNKMFLALRERGISEDEIINGAGLATAQFATVMRLSFEDAAVKLADMKGALGIENAKDLPELVELITKTKSATGLTLDNLQATLKYASAGFKAQDVTGIDAAKDVMALLAVSKKGGAVGSTAGTSTSNVLDLITDIEKAVNKKSFQDRFGQLLASKNINFEFHDKDGNFKGFENMLEQFGKLNVFDNKLQAQIIGELGNARARRLIQGWLVSGGAGGYEQARQNIDKQAGLEYRIKNIMDTITQQWGLIWANVENVIGSIGAAIERNFNIKDKMASIADFIGKIASWINRNPKAVDNMLKKAAEILKVVTAVGGAFVVIGTVISAVGTVLTFAAALPEVVTAIASAKAVVAWLIGGLSYIGVVIYEMWPTIVNIFKGIREGIESFEPLKQAKDQLINSFKDLWGEIEHYFKHVSNIDWFEAAKLAGTAAAYIIWLSVKTLNAIIRFIVEVAKYVNILTFIAVRVVDLTLALEKAVKGGREARKHFLDELRRIPEDLKRVTEDIKEIWDYDNGNIIPRNFVGPIAPGMANQNDIDARNFNKNFKNFTVNSLLPTFEQFQKQLNPPSSAATASKAASGNSGSKRAVIPSVNGTKEQLIKAYYGGTINYSPVINVGESSPATLTAFRDELYRHAQDIADIMLRRSDERSRLAIGGWVSV